MPSIMLKFATVAVVVRNEKRAMKWWKEKIGFRVVTSFPHWVTVAPRGANVHLHLCPDSRPEKGNTGFMFSTPDAAKEEARLRKKGVENMNPVFPFSGRESGQRWRWTFAPRGATVTQWGNEVTTRKPIFSFHHFMALFSFRTTTATVANLSMIDGIET